MTLFKAVKSSAPCNFCCSSVVQTALHLAVITNQPHMVEILLKASASASVCDRKGNTAVHLAIKYRTPACLESILINCRIQLDLDAKNYEGEPFARAQGQIVSLFE